MIVHKVKMTQKMYKRNKEGEIVCGFNGIYDKTKVVVK